MFLRRHTPGQRRHQHGAAALIVVMLLFFVISLVAAYTSRNLIFEQRTAANQYRSTQAMEAAEAGVEWAIAQLNAGLINDTCGATTATSGTGSFRQRYLSIDSASGDITHRGHNVTTGAPASVTPMCVFDGRSGGVWSCRCPQPDALPAALATPSGAGTEVAPAFVVRFRPVAASPARPDLIQLESNSCTRFNPLECLNFNTTGRGGTGDGVASVRVALALRGAINRLPVAPLTVLGTLAPPPSGVTLSLSNPEGAVNGITLHTAGAAPGTGLNLSSAPGSAAASSVISNDATLQIAAQTAAGFSANDLRFASFFGMSPQTYRNQPGLPTLDCSSGCDGDDIEDVVERNPGRPIWLTGSSGTVTLDENLGSDTNPVMLIVEGDLVIDSGVEVRGVIYHRAKPGGGDTTWDVDGTAAIRGAVIVEGGLTLDGSSATPTLVYSPVVLRAVKVSMGSFVRVPGSWRDF